MKKYDIVKMIKEYLIVTLGVILVSFGLQYFYAPNDIAGGGLSGLALVINHYVPFLSTGTLVFLGNLILFVIAFLLIGSDFGAKTLYASFALSFEMDFMEAFATNASTGGTDILAKILNKYTKFNIGRALLMVDLFVVVFGAITFGLNKGFYSLIAVVINGLLVDKVIDMIGKYKQKKAAEELNEEKVA